MSPKKPELTQKQRNLRREIASQLLTLSTSSFGLVAALAWNEAIKEAINKIIKPLFGESSNLISLTAYALIITIIAVTVTYNLSKIKEKL